ARRLHRTCWKAQCHSSAERAAAKLPDDHPDLPIVAPREMTSEEIPPSWRSGGVLPAHAYEKVRKGTEGAQPAMLAGGSQTGKLVWVKPAYPVRSARQPEPEIVAGDPSTTPEAALAPVKDLLAERRAKHMNPRIPRI